MACSRTKMLTSAVPQQAGARRQTNVQSPAEQLLQEKLGLFTTAGMNKV